MKNKNIYALIVLIVGVFVVFTSFRSFKDDGSGQIKVMIVTDYGTIKIRLYNETPLHRDNFVKLVKEHYFDSLLFHRVIKDFMIQGGDPESKHARQGEQLGQGSL